MRVALTATAGLGLAVLLSGAVSSGGVSVRAAPAGAVALGPGSTTMGSTASAGTGPTRTGPAEPARTVADFARQRLAWAACPAEQRELNEAGARCAEVTVPLDYAEPGGRTIRIAVSRIKARSPEGRSGILLSNPGGPGGTGLAYTLALRPALGDAADRYDLIGFDPRFLGGSTPVSCAPAGPPTPPPEVTSPRQDYERSVRSARDTARRCQVHGDNAELLPHASTRNVARDMDLIRAVLGERRLSFYGVSYGADLGAVYTQMFPAAPAVWSSTPAPIRPPPSTSCSSGRARKPNPVSTSGPRGPPATTARTGSAVHPARSGQPCKVCWTAPNAVRSWWPDSGWTPRCCGCC